MNFYHGTKKENVHSILEKGLLISGNKRNRKWCIYLTDNMEIAKRYGEAVFMVTITKNDNITGVGGCLDECLVWNDITPEKLKIIATNYCLSQRK